MVDERRGSPRMRASMIVGVGIALLQGCFPELPQEVGSDVGSGDLGAENDVAPSTDGGSETATTPDIDAPDGVEEEVADGVMDDGLVDASPSCQRSDDCGLAAPCEGAWSCEEGACRRVTPVVCAGDGLCMRGVCAPTVPRADEDGCILEPAAAATACDDGDLCTSGETCGGGADAGRCVATEVVACDQASDCRSAGTCNPATGVCEAVTETDGVACSDATWPDGEEGVTGTCRSGVCLALPRVSVGVNHTCAILGDGRLFCWGDNSWGQLGLGFSDTNVGDGLGPSLAVAGPVDLGGRRAVDVSAGYGLTCVVLEHGGVRCWGRAGIVSGFPELTIHGYPVATDLGGTEDTKPSLIPDLPFSASMRRVNVGGAHVCTLSESGQAYCWGDNAHGKVGYAGVRFVAGVPPSFFDEWAAVFEESGQTWGSVGTLGPVDVGRSEDGPIRSMALSDFGTCALMENGRVYCWGVGGVPDVDAATGIDVVPSTIPHVSGALVARGVFSARTGIGSSELCFSWSDRSIRCRGWSTSQGGPPWSNGPVFGFNQLKDFVVGGFNSPGLGDRRFYCALSSGGNTRCSGYNGRGQVGKGDTAYVNQAVDVALGSSFEVHALSAGGESVCAVTTAGDVLCWGNNGSGQLGVDSTNHIGDEPSEMPPAAVRFE